MEWAGDQYAVKGLSLDGGLASATMRRATERWEGQEFWARWARPGAAGHWVTTNSKGGTHNGTTGGLSDASEASVRLVFRVFVMRVSQTHARLSDGSAVRIALAGDRS
jgi:hypothetical protein